MDDFSTTAILRKHLVLTRRIRALDPKKDSVEFAEGRLRDYAARIIELIRLRNSSPTEIPSIEGVISVSIKVLGLKRQQFKLPVVYGDEISEDGLEDGGTGIPLPIYKGPFTLSGSGSRLFSESEECHDW